MYNLYIPDEYSEDFKYKFLLPSDCLLVLKTVADFKCNGIYLYTNVAPCKISYLSNIEERLMTMCLAKTISLNLGLELLQVLSLNPSEINNFKENLNQEVRLLKLRESQEGGNSPNYLPKEHSDNWINVR